MALDVVARDGGLINDVAAGADCGGLYRTLIPVQNGGGEGAGQVGGGGALGRSAPRGDGLEVENKIRGRSGAGVADRVEIVRSVKKQRTGVGERGVTVDVHLDGAILDDKELLARVPVGRVGSVADVERGWVTRTFRRWPTED
jgi:hypothetical protein